MDFEPFAPITPPCKGEEKKDNETLLKEEIVKLKKENFELKRQLEREKFSHQSERVRLEEEKKRLLEKINFLQTQNMELQNRVNSLQKSLEELKTELEMTKNFKQNLETKIEKALEEQKRQILEISLKVLTESLKGLLLTEKIQDEETLRRIFKELFSEKIFTGEITVKVNPQDVPLIKDILGEKEQWVFDILTDPKLQRGEIEIETERFFVERKYNRLVEEFVNELLQRFTQEGEQTGH
ncbi:MAG TPA: hypothetical protein EYP42_05805 [Aquificales bacterium]|nr:hypothetical protein [Aquificales bacterium]